MARSRRGEASAVVGVSPTTSSSESAGNNSGNAEAAGRTKRSSLLRRLSFKSGRSRGGGGGGGTDGAASSPTSGEGAYVTPVKSASPSSRPMAVGGSSRSKLRLLKRRSSSSGLMKSPRSLRKGEKSSPRSNGGSASPVVGAGPGNIDNAVQWLQHECPLDVLPKVFAYAGPKKTAALSRTNKFFYSAVNQEGTWRVMCEELYKWKQGDPVPQSWAQYYRFNPCVPVDYSSVHDALDLVSQHALTGTKRLKSDRQLLSIRILLRPGKYNLEETFTVSALDGVEISIESMKLPENVFRPRHRIRSEEFVAPPASSPAPLSRRRSKSLVNLMTCNRRDVHSSVVDTEPTEFSESSSSDDLLWEPSTAPEVPKRTTISYKTRSENKPAFRVKRGALRLKGVGIQHNCRGVDIWNGNSAIQVQPDSNSSGADSGEAESFPRAVLDDVEVVSRSGRGIVNIDGGEIIIRECAFHHCAATGVYVGGPGSRATLERTDVVGNGVGNNRRRNAIARGHSGIYLEQGDANITDCNISGNSLTGISSVSPEKAILRLEDCDLVGNGTYQLEIPPLGTVARRESVINNNNLATAGPARGRSKYLKSPAQGGIPLMDVTYVSVDDDDDDEE